MFLHHGKQDFSVSSQVKESMQTNSNMNNSPSTTDTETKLKETTHLSINLSHKPQQHVLVAFHPKI